MKLKKEEYYDSGGRVRVTEQGWVDLRKFCQAIVFKNYRKLPFYEDLISECLLECIDSLDTYEPTKNSELGGWLYWKVRGAVSKFCYKNSKEIPVDFNTVLLDEGEERIC